MVDLYETIGVGIIMTFALASIMIALSASLVFQLFCIVWAPFAGLKCASIARANGLEVWRYALVGAVYAVLLFAPWRYLIKRMQGSPFSYEESSGTYNLLYAFWMLWIVSYTSFLGGGALFAAIPFPPEELSWSYFLKEYGVWVTVISIAVVSSIAWIISRRNVFSKLCVRKDKPNSLVSHPLPELALIMPFAYATLIFFPSTVFAIGYVLYQ